MPQRSWWLAYALCVQAGQKGAQNNITLAATAAASCKAFQHSGCTSGEHAAWVAGTCRLALAVGELLGTCQPSRRELLRV